jgi:hypothetical protein
MHPRPRATHPTSPQPSHSLPSTARFGAVDGSATYAQLRAPTDVDADVLGTLYILEANGTRVRLLSTPTGVITTMPAAIAEVSPGGASGQCPCWVLREAATDRHQCTRLWFDLPSHVHVRLPAQVPSRWLRWTSLAMCTWLAPAPMPCDKLLVSNSAWYPYKVASHPTSPPPQTHTPRPTRSLSPFH